MKNSLYFLFFAVVFFTSCNEDEVPESSLSGTYEVVQENPETNTWYAGQIQFKPDGTYEHFGLARESQNGADLGYFSYSKGTYTPKGEEFVINVTESLILENEDYPAGYAESLEDLEVQELPAEVREFERNLKILDGGKKIALFFKCGPLELCAGERIFFRVD